MFTPVVRRRPARIPASISVCLVLILFTLVNAFTASAGPDDRMTTLVSPHYNKLMETARTNGTVRVIIGLKASFKPEGIISNTATVQRQRDGIASTRQAVLRRLREHDARLLHSYDYVPFMAMEVDAATLKALATDPSVSSLHADEKQAPALFENVAFIGGDAQFTFGGYTGAGQTVAILDSGVDSTHPFLQGKVVSEACYSTPNKQNGEESLCPNGENSQVGPGSARPGCPFQLCDHGTHVAGIIAGNQMTIDFEEPHGPQTLAGVAKGASIIAIQVFERDPGDKISTYPTDQIKALERVYALRNEFRIAAVNMSLGGERYTSQEECDSLNPSIKAAIDLLRSVGIATIVSSGNAGYIDSTSSPACLSSVISVGSVGYDETSVWISESSNRASWLSLYAPGIDIVSAGFGDSGDWTAKSGTSQAAPHVAGAWAVLREKAPSASIDDILTALQSTGIDVPDFANSFVKKRIQVTAALEQVGVTGCARILCEERLWLPMTFRQ